jgi:hypothetical protein
LPASTTDCRAPRYLRSSSWRTSFVSSSLNASFSRAAQLQFSLRRSQGGQRGRDLLAPGETLRLFFPIRVNAVIGEKFSARGL